MIENFFFLVIWNFDKQKYIFLSEKNIFLFYNLISLIGSIYVASAKSSDDSIYNMFRPTMKKAGFLNFSQEEKSIFFSLWKSQGEFFFNFFSSWDFHKKNFL